jgi:hypothetical protein
MFSFSFSFSFFFFVFCVFDIVCNEFQTSLLQCSFVSGHKALTPAIGILI